MTAYDVARFIEVRLASIPEMAIVQYYRADSPIPSGTSAIFAIGSWSITKYSNVYIGSSDQYVDGYFEILLSFDRRRLEAIYDLANTIVSYFPRETLGALSIHRAEVHTPYVNTEKSRYFHLSANRLNLPIIIKFQFVKD